MLKLDAKVLQQDSIEYVIDFANVYNAHSSVKLLIGRLAEDAAAGSISLLSDPQNAPRCQDDLHCQRWASSFAPMVGALKGNEGVMVATDYFDDNVMTAYDYSPALQLGFVLQIDVAEFQKPLLIQLAILLCTAVGIACGGVVALGLFAKKMMDSIEDRWQRGKKAVQQQKEQFEGLVSSLLPKFASERLLAGDPEIVMDVPEVYVPPKTISFDWVHAFFTF